MKKIFFFLLIFFIHRASLADDTKRWYADYYAGNALLQQSWAIKFFFQNYIFQGNEVILDIGSGRGNVSAMIANYVPQGAVIAIDNVESLVKKSSQDYKYIKNLSFFLREAEDQSFYNLHKEKFDVITSLFTFPKIRNQDKILQGIFTALKPEGLCYLRLISKGGDPIQDIADGLVKTQKWKNRFINYKNNVQRFSIGEYAALLEKNNLRIISINDMEDRDVLNNIEQLKIQIKSWLPYYHYLADIDGNLANKFIDEVIAIYIMKYPANQNGEVILYDHHLEIIATKLSNNP